MGKVAGGAHGEVALAAAILDYYAQHGEAFMTPASVPGAPGAKVLTLPLGILLAVEPWNFPYYQVARVVGPQLMVGNVVMLKHAENVPQSALAFAELLESAGPPPGVFTNIFASPDQIARLHNDPPLLALTVTGRNPPAA